MGRVGMYLGGEWVGGWAERWGVVGLKGRVPFSYLKKLLCFAITLCLCGCNPTEVDVTNDPAFGSFASDVSGNWKTRKPLIVVRGEFGDGITLGLVSKVHSSSWEKISDVPIGSTININRLMLQQSVSTSVLWITGRLKTGEHADQELMIQKNLLSPDVYLFYEVNYRNTQNSKRPKWSVSEEWLERQ